MGFKIVLTGANTISLYNSNEPSGLLADAIAAAAVTVANVNKRLGRKEGTAELSVDLIVSKALALVDFEVIGDEKAVFTYTLDLSSFTFDPGGYPVDPAVLSRLASLGFRPSWDAPLPPQETAPETPAAAPKARQRKPRRYGKAPVEAPKAPVEAPKKPVKPLSVLLQLLADL